MHEKLGAQLAGLDPAVQVDVLWALCVLQQARGAELQAVLRPELHAQFLGEQLEGPFLLPSRGSAWPVCLRPGGGLEPPGLPGFVLLGPCCR